MAMAGFRQLTADGRLQRGNSQLNDRHVESLEPDPALFVAMDLVLYPGRVCFQRTIKLATAAMLPRIYSWVSCGAASPKLGLEASISAENF